jgi:hypothetical protein
MIPGSEPKRRKADVTTLPEMWKRQSDIRPRLSVRLSASNRKAAAGTAICRNSRRVSGGTASRDISDKIGKFNQNPVAAGIPGIGARNAESSGS